MERFANLQEVIPIDAAALESALDPLGRDDGAAVGAVDGRKKKRIVT